MDDYMRNYGARLQSLLAGEPGSGAMGGGGDQPPVSGFTDQGQIPPDQGLGPDLYRNTGLERMPGGGGGGGAAPGGAPGGSPQAQPPAQPGGQPGADGKPSHQGTGPEGAGFRDVWNAQDKATRQKYLDKLDDNLKSANESIDGAYKTMMQQLGGRPDPNLSKSEKGMLLMEFGLRMMQHSSGRAGYGRDTGAAAGAAGVETIQSMRGLQNQKLARQQRYDQLEQQLTIAQGREKSNLAARSALETGRDLRAFGQQDTQIEREGMRQEGANARAAGRTASALSIATMRESGANTRANLRHGELSRQFTNDQGEVQNVFKDGHTEPALDKDGKPMTA
ncbi:MAG TPA: hypothetical protein VH208_02915, partial [Myxococcaceae bacterium]|nr:hypothetical protein [Myxococcaceae bacterium]